MPFHKGHQYLIDTAVKQCEQVYVLVSYTKYDPLPGELRLKAVEEHYQNQPQVVVEGVDSSSYPQYDHECMNKDSFYFIWNEIIQTFIPHIDAVFTSEEYGDDFAYYLSQIYGPVEHVLVDLERTQIPISGTQLRENYDPQYVPLAMRKKLVKKVAIVGPEASGKTTLAKNLAKIYQEPWVKEYGRLYFEERELNLKSRQKENFSLHDISHIAAGQITDEDQQLEQAQRVLICDTELITTQIWSEIYFEQCPPWIEQESYRRTYDLYFLMDIDFDWVDDGTREFPDKREWHFECLKEELEKRKLNYKLISGSVTERLIQGKKWIDDLIYKEK